MLKAIIFDMDGVIFDSEQAIIDCYYPVAEAYGIKDVLPQCLKCIGITEEECTAVFQAAYGADFPYKKMRGEVNALYRTLCDEGRLPVKEGAAELLQYLKAHGLRLALASSGKIEHVRRLLGNAGFLDYFDVVIGGDMVSRGKPEPDVFLKALEELNLCVTTANKEASQPLESNNEASQPFENKTGLRQEEPLQPDECLVIEDSYNGVRAAYTARIPVIMVPDLLPPTDECKEKAQKIFRSLTEVKTWMESNTAGE